MGGGGGGCNPKQTEDYRNLKLGTGIFSDFQFWKFSHFYWYIGFSSVIFVGYNSFCKAFAGFYGH